MTIKQLTLFLKQDIWTVDEQKLPRHKQIGLYILRRIVITAESFVENKLASFTAALTYSCILAAVPVLSIILAIARGFGFGNFIEERVRQNIQVGSEMADTIFDFIEHYLEHLRGGVFLGMGILLLIYTVVMLTSNIETAFNTIWHVRSPRNIYRQIVNYVSVFMLLPLLIVVTSGFSVFMLTIAGDWAEYVIISSTMEFVIRYTPVLISGISFVALYKLLPNTHVRWRSVIIPGLLAGVLFQLLQYIYIHYQLEISSYNAIYGSFAALPLFMLWLQLSWYICLIGAQMSYANQRADEYAFTKDSKHLSRHDHDALCLLLMTRICTRFRDGEGSYSAHSLSNATHLPHSTVQGLLDELSAVGLVFEIHRENAADSHYLPARDIQQMCPNYILHRLDEHGRGSLSMVWKVKNPEWARISQTRSSLHMRGGSKSVTEWTQE